VAKNSPQRPKTQSPVKIYLLALETTRTAVGSCLHRITFGGFSAWPAPCRLDFSDQYASIRSPLGYYHARPGTGCSLMRPLGGAWPTASVAFARCCACISVGLYLVFAPGFGFNLSSSFAALALCFTAIAGLGAGMRRVQGWYPSVFHREKSV